MSTALIIPAAGSGTRLGADRPKAFVLLAGQTLLAHAIDGAIRSTSIDSIVIAAPTAMVEEARTIAAAVTRNHNSPHGCEEAGVPITVVAGGTDRVESVAAALAVVPHADHVLVHDAARCLTPVDVFHRVTKALDAGAAAVIPVLPVTDTVKTVAPDGAVVGNLDRSTLRRVQTPQGFTRDVLVAAHHLQRTDPDPAATDDAGLVERLGTAVVAVAGDEAALKITHPIDMRIAELYLKKDL